MDLVVFWTVDGTTLHCLHPSNAFLAKTHLTLGDDVPTDVCSFSWEWDL